MTSKLPKRARAADELRCSYQILAFKLVKSFANSDFALHTVFPFTNAHFNNLLHLFPIFLLKYKEMRLSKIFQTDATLFCDKDTQPLRILFLSILNDVESVHDICMHASRRTCIVFGHKEQLTLTQKMHRVGYK